MANKTIGELPEADPLDGTELVHLVQEGNSRKKAVSALASTPQMLALLNSLLPPRFVQGLELSNNGADATNDIDIAAGTARGNSVVVANAGTLVKRLDAAWAAGTNQGGIDAGSKANSSTYHLHAIRNNSSGAFDALFSLSATAPTVPSGWTRVERLGAVLTDGAGAIRGFVQTKNVFSWRDAIQDRTGALPTAASTLTVSVPVGVKVCAKYSVQIYDTGFAVALASSLEENDQTPTTTTLGSVSNGLAGGRGFAEIYTVTNTSAQFRLRGIDSGGGSADQFLVFTRGWEDYTVPRI